MSPRYDRIAMTLHWVIAALVLLQFATGWSWGMFERGSDGRFFLFRTHLVSGWAILVLAIARLAYRLSVPQPPLPDGMSRLQRSAAHASHGLLYLAILVQPLLGIVTVSAFGKTLGGWPGAVHVALAWIITAIVLVHVLAALWHQFGRRDRLLERMLPMRLPSG
ncbi:cytochrome b [Geminicoccus harenae]|uniref:cytochrome b n=1 Tax=Geminicoccus harenae TaxID=2498453 RepID=UPI00168BD71A|nr:cytochrome b [Geminicoccus harenae]